MTHRTVAQRLASAPGGGPVAPLLTKLDLFGIAVGSDGHSPSSVCDRKRNSATIIHPAPLFRLPSHYFDAVGPPPGLPGTFLFCNGHGDRAVCRDCTGETNPRVLSLAEGKGVAIVAINLSGTLFSRGVQGWG